MNLENSGNIYSFDLDFNLGKGFAEVLDFSDSSIAGGVMAQVYNLIIKDDKDVIDLNKILGSGLLFGPVLIFNYPKKKGKSRWNLLAKNNNFSRELPIFKYTNKAFQLFDKDWTKIDTWWKDYFGRDKIEQVYNYEEVRKLEDTTLYSEEDIVIRTTMQYLIFKNSNLTKYYNLKEPRNRRIFIFLINSLDKAKTMAMEEIFEDN